MMVPFSVTSMDTAMPAETMLAPQCPIINATASEAGRGDAAITLAGNTYCTPAFTRMYNTPTVPKHESRGQRSFFSGYFTKPATILRTFHPLYAHRAATSAAMNPAIPPLAFV